VAAAVYGIAFLASGLRYSFSAVNRDEALGPFFQKDMALAVTACALTLAVLGAWRGRQAPVPSLRELATASWLGTAVLVLFFAAKMALVYWQSGIFLRWHMPDPVWGFGFYLDALAVMAVGFSGPVLPLVTWAAARLAAFSLPDRQAAVSAS